MPTQSHRHLRMAREVLDPRSFQDYCRNLVQAAIGEGECKSERRDRRQMDHNQARTSLNTAYLRTLPPRESYIIAFVCNLNRVLTKPLSNGRLNQQIRKFVDSSRSLSRILVLTLGLCATRNSLLLLFILFLLLVIQ